MHPINKNGVTIAVAGKGGTGKTTISGIIISHLIRNSSSRILAVDADPSENLGFILGVKTEETLGGIREETCENMINFPPGMTKAQYLEYRINQAVQEFDKFDLLTMGRSEGPGCYCYVNRLLRTALDTLSDNYSHVIMDCEAGMEHVSRRTSRGVDHLLLVSDPSVRGLDVALRIALMTDTLQNSIGQKHLILNRSQPGNETTLSEKIDRVMDIAGINTYCIVPEDSKLSGMDMAGKSVFELPLNIESSAIITDFLNKELHS